ncbi:MAG: hypothetical protein H5T99_06565, partial [Moorella sp. (in: Bacteria)]|nr:hypothetical protein [Moorella sp. (in: firmicutes)]
MLGAVELAYTVTPGGGEPQDIRYRVPLAYTPCNYGGERPWFVCPGRGCGRRAAKLYLKGGIFSAGAAMIWPTRARGK